MSNKAFSFIFLLLVLSSCRGHHKDAKQETTTTGNTTQKAPVKSTPARSMEEFLPEGYVIKDTTRGDLNRDEYPDMILIASIKEEDSISHSVDSTIFRPLIILLGQPDGSLKQVARNDHVVYCASCGGMMGDPYVQTVIKDGYFSIEHYGGSSYRWGMTITFKYIPAERNWYLHRIGEMTFTVDDPDGTMKETGQTTKDFGKVRFEEYDIYEDRD